MAEEKSLIAAAVARMKSTGQISGTIKSEVVQDGYPDEAKYKAMGMYEPFKILKANLTEEEFRGWVKGEALVYILREKAKGGDKDLVKALRVLQFLGE